MNTQHRPHLSRPRLVQIGAGLASAALVATGLAAVTQSTAHANPTNSHCGLEPAGNRESFVNHAQLTSELDRIERSTNGVVSVSVAGHSNQGRAIYQARVGTGDEVLLIQSQIHGNENHGTEALLKLLGHLGGNSREAKQIRDAMTIVAIPRLNVDGGEHDTRQNAMSWNDVVAKFPQLAGSRPAWNYRSALPGFDVNRDFNPDLDYVPKASDFPGNSAGTGWYITPEAQTVRDVYRGLEQEFGLVDYFVDLHNQWPCYKQEGTDNMSSLSISARFIADPTAFGNWPNFNYDASRRANVAVYNALQGHGNSGWGHLTLYPQDTNLPGTALGSFALRGSATVLFETSSNTQSDGQKRNGYLRKQVETGVMGLIAAITDGSINRLDPEAYEKIPKRVTLPADGPSRP